MKITAINVFIDMDGKHFIAPIKAEFADIFMAMLAGCQADSSEGARLVPMHEDIAQHLIATRQAIFDRLEFLKAEKQKAMNKNASTERSL